jgi:large subunit ribosomal protein L21
VAFIWPPILVSSDVSTGSKEATVYAIIRAGGKQYRAAEGETIYVESLQAPVGESVSLGEVLLVGSDDEATRLGSPFLVGAKVAATVVESGRGQKIRVFKYKKRKHYRRTRGHRQSFTALRIDRIQL